jgi:hypothetical protein
MAVVIPSYNYGQGWPEPYTYNVHRVWSYIWWIPTQTVCIITCHSNRMHNYVPLKPYV